MKLYIRSLVEESKILHSVQCMNINAYGLIVALPRSHTYLGYLKTLCFHQDLLRALGFVFISVSVMEGFFLLYMTRCQTQ